MGIEENSIFPCSLRSQTTPPTPRAACSLRSHFLSRALKREAMNSLGLGLMSGRTVGRTYRLEANGTPASPLIGFMFPDQRVVY